MPDQCRKQFLNKAAAPRLICSEGSKEVTFTAKSGKWPLEMESQPPREGGCFACAQSRSPAVQQGAGPGF